MPLSRQEEQEDRREYLENEKRLKGATYMAHTHNDIGGRFAAISSPHVVGSELIPKYPAAFLNHDPVPDEPPLSYDNPTLELSAVLEPLPPAQEPLDRVMTAKATPSASEKSPLGAEGFSKRAYRRA